MRTVECFLNLQEMLKTKLGLAETFLFFGLSDLYVTRWQKDTWFLAGFAFSLVLLWWHQFLLWVGSPSPSSPSGLDQTILKPLIRGYTCDLSWLTEAAFHGPQWEIHCHRGPILSGDFHEIVGKDKLSFFLGFVHRVRNL